MFFRMQANVLILLLMSAPVMAQTSAMPDPLFLDDETLDVAITAPWTTLVRTRPKDDYLPGTFRYAESDGSIVQLDVEIRTRGNFRHANCDFPPLTLNFKTSQIASTLFDQQDKLKLVVHCEDSDRHEQVVLREYLAYKILNTVTEMSFRARLLRVTYVDSEQQRNDQVRYAFIIEHKNRLAARYGLQNMEIAKTSVSAMQPDSLNLTSVFEFLIGNTDFSPVAGPPGDGCCHNYVLFGAAGLPLIAVPYDFDQSGLVDAPYAKPSSNFRIRSVRQRVYRGRCANNVQIPSSLQKFRERRDEINGLVATQVGMDDRSRKSVRRYVDDFYQLIDDPRRVERDIVEKCI